MDKFVFGKITNKKLSKDSSMKESLCYFYETLGYRETMKMPIPVFFSLIKYLNKKNSKGKKKSDNVSLGRKK